MVDGGRPSALRQVDHPDKRIDESDSEPLVGMALMDGFCIPSEDVDGGLVQIERI